MAVTRVPYEAEEWGEGELWFDGPRLVWHELPRPHPHPGGERSRRPQRSTLATQPRRVSDEFGPIRNQLVHDLRRFFEGIRVDFAHVELDLDGYSQFQLALLEALRAVPYGHAVSYGELAQAAGRPAAQRAAGTFCARNRYPLIVPCHRVVSASGIGSYGSLGVEYKRRLLSLEGCRDVV